MPSPIAVPKNTLLGTSLAMLMCAPGLGQATTVSWDAGDGYWDVATNWSPALPASEDDVIFNVDGDNSRTITVRSTGSPFTVNSVNTDGGNEVLSIIGGTLNLTGASTSYNSSGLSTVASFSQSQSFLTGTGDLNVTGNATIFKGSQTGSGTTTFLGNTVIDRYLNLDSGRELVNAGNLVFHDSINLNPTDANGGSGHITNTGTWDVAGDYNTISASYTTESDASGMGFTNEGLLRKTAGTNSSSISVVLDNTGTIEVQSGTLVLSGGGVSNAGTLGATAGTELQFGGGEFTLGGTTGLDGQGTLAVTRGTVNADVVASFKGATAVRGGVFMINQEWTTVEFKQSGNSILSGSGNLIVTDKATFYWANQIGTGNTLLQGETTLNDWFYLDSGRSLINTGHLTMQEGSFVNLNPTDNNGGSGSIVNTGIWDIAVDRNISASHSSGTDAKGMGFTNGGLLRKTAGTGTSAIGVRLSNTGTIEVQSGTLSLNGGGSYTAGSLEALSGAVLQLGGGTHTLEGSLDIDIEGTLAFYNGTIDSNRTMNTVNFSQLQSSLTGTGDLNVTGNATIFKGSQTGSGTTTFLGNTVIDSYLNLDSGRELVNAGNLVMYDSINLNPTDANGGSGHITNTGAWDVAGDYNTISASYTTESDASGMGFTNESLLRKTAGTNSSSISVVLDNTGTIEVQSGTLVLSGGGVSSAGTLGATAGTELQFGGGEFTLGGTTGFDGQGTLAVTRGTVNADVIASFKGATAVRGGVFMINQEWTTAEFKQSGNSILSGSGNLIVTDKATFYWANQIGTGNTLLQGETTLNDWFYLDSGRSLINTGHLTMQEGSFVNLNPTDNNGGSGSIINTGIWDIAVDRNISASHSSGTDAKGMGFTNGGLLRKTAGTGTSAIGVSLSNTGTIEVQSGTLSLTNSEQAGFINNGTVTTKNGATFALDAGSSKTLTNSGLIAGTGTVALQGSRNNLVNRGTINAGGENATGELIIDLGSNGSYQQDSDGFLSFDLSDVDYDTLVFDGTTGSTVSLGGTLSINALSAFTPAIDSLYTLITLDQGSFEGTFDSLLSTGFDSSIAFFLEYNEHSVLLRTSASPVPLPSSGLFLLSGLMLLCSRRGRSLTSGM